jgi:hypothetical protein
MGCARGFDSHAQAMPGVFDMNRATLLILISVSWIGVAEFASAQDQLLWGDTHLHSSNSFDAYLTGNETADPATAYRYAMGLPVIHPGHRGLVQIGTPFDFLVVADHAELLGSLRYAMERGIPEEDLGFFGRIAAKVGVWYMEGVLEEGEGREVIMRILDASETVADAAASTIDVPAPVAQIKKTICNEAIKTADTFNTPGEFTALIGWEWSSIPGGANLHRVVFTSADASIAKNFLPYGSDASAYPEDLWHWLDETSAATGADFVAWRSKSESVSTPTNSD